MRPAAPAGFDDAEAQAWQVAQRGWQGLLLVLVVIGGAMLAARAPGVQAILGNSFLEIALGAGSIALCAALGTVLYYTLGGRSRVYRHYDAVETLIVQLALHALIYLSHNPSSPLWALAIFHICISSAAYPWLGFARALSLAYLALPAAQAVAHLVQGNVERAVLCFVMTSVAGMALYFGRAMAANVRALAAERMRLTSELAATRLLEDRRRIARDLHDGLGADLAAIAWRAAALAKRADSTRTAADLESLTARATGGIDEIRSVVWALHAPERSWLELVTYLRERIQELAVGVATLGTPRPLIELEAHPESGGEAELEMPGAFTADFVRFVLEAVRNAIAHGGGEVPRVRLSAGERIEAHITNPRSGGDIPTRAGRGLDNLRARAALMGGTVEIGERDGVFVVRLSAPRPTRPAPAVAQSRGSAR